MGSKKVATSLAIEDAASCSQRYIQYFLCPCTQTWPQVNRSWIVIQSWEMVFLFVQISCISLKSAIFPNDLEFCPLRHWKSRQRTNSLMEWSFWTLYWIRSWMPSTTQPFLSANSRPSTPPSRDSISLLTLNAGSFINSLFLVLDHSSWVFYSTRTSLYRADYAKIIVWSMFKA